MADTKRSRAAKLGARTRARNVSLHGPTSRSTAQGTEDLRITTGEKTLADAYCGVPSRANFLKDAHLFERVTHEGKTAKTDRAYIVPDGLESLRRGEDVDLFWYRRNTSVEQPNVHETAKVVTRDGEQYMLQPMEDAPMVWQASLNHKSFARRCTGVVRFYVS
jgi:hypothetical protein